jgi:hypothetical protein
MASISPMTAARSSAARSIALRRRYSRVLLFALFTIRSNLALLIAIAVSFRDV